MQTYTTCHLCTSRGKLENGAEIARVNSNVRAFKTELFAVWRCPFCGSLHARDEVDLDHYYKGYPFHGWDMTPLVKSGFKKRLNRLKEAGFCPENALLDFGCGSGTMVTYLKDMGYAKATGYDEYNANCCDKAVLDRQYDFIICQDVIEHTADPRELLRNILTSLKPGGIISIGTPNAGVIDLKRPEYYLMQLHQPYHRHIFTEKSLTNMAEDMGLRMKNKYTRYYLDFLRPFASQKYGTEYFLRTGNDLESVLSDKIDYTVALSPKMLFYAFWGYFFPTRTEMEIIFEKVSG